MSSGLITGFIEGAVEFGPNGSVRTIPFANKVGEVTLTYEGTLTFARTSSGQGIFGASNACLVSEEATLRVMSKDITWGMFQMALAQAAVAAGGLRQVQETVFIPVVTPAGTATYTLAAAPAAGEPFRIVDTDGDLVSGATVTGAVVSDIPTTAQGRELTFIYYVPHLANAEAIYVGSDGVRFSEAAIYGRFRMCGANPSEFGALYFVAPRAVLKPALTLGVSEGSEGEASVEFTLLRGTLDGRSNVYFGLYKSGAV